MYTSNTARNLRDMPSGATLSDVRDVGTGDIFDELDELSTNERFALADDVRTIAAYLSRDLEHAARRMSRAIQRGRLPEPADVEILITLGRARLDDDRSALSRFHFGSRRPLLRRLLAQLEPWARSRGRLRGLRKAR